RTLQGSKKEGGQQDVRGVRRCDKSNRRSRQCLVLFVSPRTIVFEFRYHLLVIERQNGDAQTLRCPWRERFKIRDQQVGPKLGKLRCQFIDDPKEGQKGSRISLERAKMANLIVDHDLAECRYGDIRFPTRLQD